MAIILIFILILDLLFFFLILWAIISHTKSSKSGAPIIRNDYEMIKDVFKLIKPDKVQKFYDLGSAYGDVVFIAKDLLKPKEAIGIEVSSFPYFISLIRNYFRKDKVEFIKADIKESNFSDADIIYVYLLPNLLNEIQPKLSEIKKNNKNSIIISPVFKITEMKPKHTYKRYHKKFKKEVKIYIY